MAGAPAVEGLEGSSVNIESVDIPPAAAPTRPTPPQALGQEDQSDFQVVSEGLGSTLREGDLSNQIVILMQYLQTMAIFLTPTFFLNFPTVWLNFVDWLSFTALFDITLAFGQ